MRNHNGAIAIIYKNDSNGFGYLLPTQKSGMVNFIGGGKEEFDKNIEATIEREIGEEIGLAPDQYKIKKTDLIHSFVYGDTKKGREGKQAENIVFIAEVDPDLEIFPTGELKEVNWYRKDEAALALSFEDMKEIFLEATKLIEE